MNIISINTVLSRLNVVVAKDKAIFGQTLAASRKHNEYIIPTLIETLALASLDAGSIDAIAVFVGPGSFTGIRVGLATAKAIVRVHGMSLVPINTLEYLAALADADATYAMYGSIDSFFCAKRIDGILQYAGYNMTKEQLLKYASGDDIYMFSQEHEADFDVEYVELSDDTLVSLVHRKMQHPLQAAVPVYYQLSQAEAQQVAKGLVLCLATMSDIDDIMSIDAECSAECWSRETFLLALGQGHSVYIASVDDGCVGYIAVDHCADEDCITKVAVLPQYRRKGIARRLIQEVEKLCDKERMSLEVSANNTPAKSLYDSLGYVNRRVRKSYYANGEDCFEMFKMLTHL